MQSLMRAALAALMLAAVPAVAGANPAAPAAGAPAASVARDARVAAAEKQDSADAVYEQAREALSRGEYVKAAELFGRVADRWPKSPLVEDALYFRAFALYRTGSTNGLREARTSLNTLNTRNPKGERRADAATLDTRICGELARRGDERCAATVAARAEDAGLSDAVGATVEAAVASSMAVSAEVARASAEAARTSTEAVRVEMSRPEVREAMRDASMQASMAGMSARARSRTPDECATPENEERTLALNALMQMDVERAMPVLQKVLARRDKCSEVLRRRAVMIVAQKRSPEAATILMNTARTDPDAETREQAVFWLSRVGDDRSIDFLRDLALNGTDRELRKRAVFALSNSRSPRATAVLRDVAARGNDLEVRGEAISWLGRRRDADTSAAYIRGLYPQLQERELKERALNALASQNSEANRTFLLGIATNEQEPIELRKQALFAAGRRQLPVDQVAQLYGRLKDVEMKKQVIYVLGERREPEATTHLISIAKAEKDPELRKSAIFWLSRSKDPRAADYLVSLLDK